MQRGANPEQYTPLSFSFGGHQPSSPQAPKSLGIGNIAFSDFAAQSQFKEEELQQMHELLNQKYGRNRELLDLVLRTGDSMVLSECMNKCSFSSTPSFAMNSTQSTREPCGLEMSFEPIEKFNLENLNKDPECCDPEINDDCSIKDRLDTIRGQNFSNHRPALDLYKFQDKPKPEDYSHAPSLLRREIIPRPITQEDCTSAEEAEDL